MACPKQKFDSGFAYDEFLSQGGASSDKEVIQFLMKNLVADEKIKFNDDRIFYGAGCSTIQIGKEKDGFIFGRYE